MARPAVHDWGEAPPPRTSPLYCRYHGFLIGHCLALAFDEAADAGYVSRWRELRAALDEFAIDAAIPAAPADRAEASYAGLLSAILPRLACESRELAEFAVLGGLVARQAAAIRGDDPGSAAALRLESDRLRGAYDLPAIDPRPDALPAVADPARALAPGLTYLAAIVERLEPEPDTALVLAPAVPPDVAGAAFVRLSLEHGGYRPLRAWRTPGGAAASRLEQALVDKAGLFWADVSTSDPDVLVAVGAAQAIGRPGVIVAREDAGGPRYAGRDAVIRYDPGSAEWPEGTALLMAACVAGVTLAAERGGPLHLAPNRVEETFDEVSQALGRILLPADAREAQRRGRRAMDAGDLALAEAAFDEACRLGLDDDETRLWRGWARFGLGRFAAAAGDFDAILGREPQVAPGEWRPIAAYLRGRLREAQGDLAGALHDVDLAAALGLPDADVRAAREQIAARVKQPARGVSGEAAGPSVSPA